MRFLTIAVYQFVRLGGPDALQTLRHKMKARCLELELKGTILLAPEGINCFMAGAEEKVREFQTYLRDEIGLKGLVYKENWSEIPPFNRMLVKLKKEIISMGEPDIRPDEFTGPYVSPQELKKWLDEKQDVLLLDTRNDYEVEVGTFENAMHLNVKSFREFAKKAKELPGDLKRKKVVMFCTGGIRCEKASPLFLREGFKDVYQLEGGILQYFVETQGAHYQGNCFVFDWRLSVDGALQPQVRSLEQPVNAGRHQAPADELSTA